MTPLDARLQGEDTLIFAQSKLAVAAREVLPPDASRPSMARGVPGFASDSSFTACSAEAGPAAPLTPADTRVASHSPLAWPLHGQIAGRYCLQMTAGLAWASALHPARHSSLNLCEQMLGL